MFIVQDIQMLSKRVRSSPTISQLSLEMKSFGSAMGFLRIRLQNGERSTPRRETWKLF